MLGASTVLKAWGRCPQTCRAGDPRDASRSPDAAGARAASVCPCIAKAESRDSAAAGTRDDRLMAWWRELRVDRLECQGEAAPQDVGLPGRETGFPLLTDTQ